MQQNLAPFAKSSQPQQGNYAWARKVTWLPAALASAESLEEKVKAAM